MGIGSWLAMLGSMEKSPSRNSGRGRKRPAVRGPTTNERLEELEHRINVLIEAQVKTIQLLSDIRDAHRADMEAVLEVVQRAYGLVPPPRARPKRRRPRHLRPVDPEP
ncbi:hypothetical protein DFJ69_3853 [Thermomonospora umbrina]|uniref:Uncharacterized protein n=1 Tax=Thermomonospora umbrina TaxID=111806 RepID=A0A3D9SQZ0_9ACTN|nr:hypothetical protein DFJ69_3853 [Thermomonospora umbrina]